MTLRRRTAATMALLLGLTGQAAAEEFPKLTLRMAHYVTQNLAGATVDQWFADELSKRTNGQVKVQIYWAESMGKATEILRMSAQGGVDIAGTSAAFHPAQLPALYAGTLPVATSARQAKLAWTKLYAETPLFQNEAKKFGVAPIFWHPIPTYHLQCKMPIRSLDDLKGKKIRSYGEDIPRIWRAVGAIPITVGPGEWYESLQRGTVDCMMHSFDTMVTYKIYEVAKYASTINIGAIIAWPHWWNAKRWNSLPSNVRSIVTDLTREGDEIELKKLEDAEKSAIETMKANGVEILEFQDADKFEKLKPDFIADWITKMDKLGSGKEAGEAAARWRELLAANK